MAFLQIAVLLFHLTNLSPAIPLQIAALALPRQRPSTWWRRKACLNQSVPYTSSSCASWRCGVKTVAKSAHTTTRWALQKPTIAKDVEIEAQRRPPTANSAASIDSRGPRYATPITAIRSAVLVRNFCRRRYEALS